MSWAIFLASMWFCLLVWSLFLMMCTSCPDFSAFLTALSPFGPCFSGPVKMVYPYFYMDIILEHG